VVLSELCYWDGCAKKKEGYVYFTTSKEQANHVQTLAATLGWQALIREQPPTAGKFGYRSLFVVSFNRRSQASLDSMIRREVPYKGTVYCLSVSTGFFLIRHRDRISVTGNCVHGSSYGLTAFGLKQRYPELYGKVSEAQKILDTFFTVAPKVKDWQASVIERAHKQGYLGGSDHPFRFRHWFWHVLEYKPKKRFGNGSANYHATVTIGGTVFDVFRGEDAKRAVSFFPQSTAAGVIRLTCWRLSHPNSPYYIGDMYYGRTPLRMPIHDSVVLEVPDDRLDYVLDRTLRAMTDPFIDSNGRPILPLPSAWGMGEHLTFGVEMSAGKDWCDMKKIKI
jgi:hypothetical protein